MGLESIQGFVLQDQSMSASWGTQTVRETCLIKMSSPLEDVIDVQNALPAYGSGPEPTFTIGLSYHPDRTDLILKEAPLVKEHPAGRPYWLVELVYETATWLDKTPPDQDQGRGRVGRNRRYNAGVAIKYPWNEPPTWSGGSRTVRATVFQDSAGTRLLHSNGLPLLEGIDVEIELEEHQFTWNLEFSTFDYATDIAPYVGKVNSASTFGVAAKNVLLQTCTATENYRTQNIATADGEGTTGATATHHYITMNATFLIDRRGTTHGYFREANRRVSMHTLQKVTVLGIDMYVPIAINDRGDVAQSPWPLTLLGQGYPYATLPAANPETDFYIIDPLYPKTAALHTFVSNNGLAIP